MQGFGQPVQESLHGKILEQFLKWSVLCAGLVEEGLPHGCTEIAPAHRMASRDETDGDEVRKACD